MTVLLVIIYLAFIGLGLPDSLFGAAWPTMYPELGAAVGAGGWVVLMLCAGTVVSSLLSGRLLRRFGTARVTAASVLLTGAALIGFSRAPSFAALLALALPLGLGAGAVDVGLNDYVSEHYRACHMNWLHCFWGIGAMTGPALLSWRLASGGAWRDGFALVGGLQLSLTAILLLSIPLWKKTGPPEAGLPETKAPAPERLLRRPGVGKSMAFFFLYSGTEYILGSWGGTFLVTSRGVTTARAALIVSCFYFCMTLGRLLAGFAALKLSGGLLQRAGLGCALIGALVLLAHGEAAVWLGFSLLGLGCSPVLPGALQETPALFGKDAAKDVMGLQMAAGYAGSMALPPLWGMAAQRLSFSLFAPTLLALTALLYLLCRMREKKSAPRQAAASTRRSQS